MDKRVVLCMAAVMLLIGQPTGDHQKADPKSGQPSINEVVDGKEEPHLHYKIQEEGISYSESTLIYDKQPIARVWMKVNGEAGNYEQQVAVAQALHKELEKAYPGLSRGVLADSAQATTEDPNSVSVYVGGQENGKEEIDMAIVLVQEMADKLKIKQDQERSGRIVDFD
ncbi:stage II sporulation protein P [Shouchella tritolerans]|uniref:stage II sporulation protein P n=1 Tax=Shouchella tritolerans TaxID=2979466 RepID=UPI0021E7E471|nr:stage II sporulation protein P [Shouchella tritolerans]